VLSRFRDLLLKAPNPYIEPEPEDADDELRYSYLKKRSLENDKKKRFDLMFSLDRQNRLAFLLAVEKRISDLTQTATQSETSSSGSFPDEVPTIMPATRQEINFVDVPANLVGRQTGCDQSFM